MELTDVAGDDAWFQFALLAADLRSCRRTIGFTSDLTWTETRRLRSTPLRGAARVVRSARTVTVRCSRTWPWAGVLVTAVESIQALHSGRRPFPARWAAAAWSTTSRARSGSRHRNQTVLRDGATAALDADGPTRLPGRSSVASGEWSRGLVQDQLQITGDQHRKKKSMLPLCLEGFAW